MTVAFNICKEAKRTTFKLMSIPLHCRWNLGALSCSSQARVVCPLVCAVSPHHAE